MAQSLPLPSIVNLRCREIKDIGNKIIIILAREYSNIVLFKSNQQLAKGHRVFYMKLGQLVRFFKCHTSSLATANLSASHNGKLLLQNNSVIFDPPLFAILTNFINKIQFWMLVIFLFLVHHTSYINTDAEVQAGGSEIYMKCVF